MKRLMVMLAAAALLSACGSSVKLDKVPVEDKAGMSVVDGASASAPSSNPVAPVDLTKSAQADAAQSVSRVVYFDFDSFVIRPEFQAAIEANAKLLRADTTRKAAIEGHTDERGGREYNLALGQKRAEAVRKALRLLGVADAQLEAVSFGKEKPAVPGTTEAAMEKNRRAEISFR
jgi:peptidoglycan-associated lipoprotein